MARAIVPFFYILIPECVAIIETDDDEFSELAEEAGFKKN